MGAGEIAVRDVSLTLGATQILRPLDLTFAADRVNVVLGPNGAGKSTLLKIAAGRLRPSTGKVLYGDRDVFAWPAKELARFRAFLSQHVEIDFAITVEEVVMMGRYPHFARAPGRQDHAIADAALEMVGMTAKRRRIYPTLSGGEQQRVQLARVLAQVWSEEADPGPRIIFLDEPIAALDVNHQLQMLELVRSLTSRRCTIVMTLHDLNLAVSYADHLLFLRDGALLETVEDPDAMSGDLVRRVFDVGASLLEDPQGRRLFQFHL